MDGADPLVAVLPAAAPPLGPGESARVRIDRAEPARSPLGPGESARVRLVVAPPAREPLGPGESDGKNAEDGTFITLAPHPPGPGEIAGGARQLTRIPVKG